MGEDKSADGTAVSQEHNPEEIRRQIEHTRHELGETVASLAEKTDIKSQAKQKVHQKRTSVTEKKDELLGRARQASPEGAASAASSVSHKARENPVGLAAAGAFLLGLLIGRSRR